MVKLGRFVTPLHFATLRCAALLVPLAERQEWWTEWTSELWHLLEGRGSRPNVTRFCLGAFKDAFWLRRNNPSVSTRPILCLRSPIQCVVFLVILAATSLFFAFRLPGPRSPMQLWPPHQQLFAYLFIIAVAVVVLAATTSLELGDYPPTINSPDRAKRLRRWIFLGTKFALILPIVFFGTLDLAPIICSGAIQPHGMLVGYVLAFRWVLLDQRKRCPVCLRMLTNPTRIGERSHIFLEWYGTEFICAKGHGLLHVSEIPTSSYSTQRWLYLDSSWRSLFS